MDKRLRWLNNLLCFEVAARHQSYSSAAIELCVSQAAVSQQMRQLEDNLGVSLFRREGRKMVLTPQGEQLSQACQSGFEHIVNGLNLVQEAPIEGDLTVSSTQAFCALWLVPRLFQFSTVAPNINIHVQGSNKIEDLREGKIDVAVRFSTQTESLIHPALHVEVITEDTLFPVCTPNLKQTLNIQGPEDLLRARLLSLENEKYTTWESWFAHAGVVVSPAKLQKTQVSSSDLALSAVLDGHGVMFSSQTMVGSYMRSGQLIHACNHEHPIRWKTHLVHLKSSPKQKRIGIFCDWIRANLGRDSSIL